MKSFYSLIIKMLESIHEITPDKPSFWWNTSGPRKIAAFDFDHTLVEQKSGSKFTIDANDLKPLYDLNIMKAKFTQLDKDGYVIVIITNQGGVEKGKITIDVMKQRIINFTKLIDVPIYTFASLKYDHCRKPCTGIWDYITTPSSKGGWCGDEIDVKNSFYVGDAAGRVKGWDVSKKKDFSCSDRKFAYNCGLTFLTPEEFFLNQAPPSLDKWEWGGIDPQYELHIRSKLHVPSIDTSYSKPEMIILVGCAASGKSSICSLFPTYVRVNMDTLKTKAKCIKMAKEIVARGQSLIIDNTNPDVETRKIYTDIAKANTKSPHRVRCINMNCPKELAHHLNILRVQMSQGNILPIPEIAYNIYFKKYTKPSVTEEDIDEVVEWDWVPRFENERHKTLFLMRY